MSQYDSTFDLKINVSHCDLYFMVQWFYLISWRLFDIWTLWDYASVWPIVWPQNICNTLWPIFHGPVILPNTLKTIQWLNIILWDYESVWPDMWPPNNCRSLWPIFHGPLNLPFILKTVDVYIWKTIWCLHIILSDYESVWHIWPRNKCRSLWPTFHGPVILPYIFNSIWWMNVILWKMSQCNMTVDLKINIGHSDLYFMVQWFLSFIFCSEKHFSFIGKAWFRRAVLSCYTSYYTSGNEDVHKISDEFEFRPDRTTDYSAALVRLKNFL